MEARGWSRPDFLLVSGDAYVDHPSFGHAVIARTLEAAGFKVAMLAQPDWTSARAFTEFGKPALGVLVAPGVVDSMVNHYTATKKRRSEDAYAPGGKAGLRPDRAAITYCNRIRSVWKNAPLIIGGLEAGLRRFAHYDYWDGRVRRSILFDTGADIVVYGMGEEAIVEIARRLAAGEPIHTIRDVRGTCFTDDADRAREFADQWVLDGRERGERRAVRWLPDADEVRADKNAYARSFIIEHDEQDPIRGAALCQRDGQRAVVQMPPRLPLGEDRMDAIYELPYERRQHPVYDAAGGVPALSEVRFSVVSHRGCYGGCSFCAINFHQGRIVSRRSQDSILREVETLVAAPGFKGYIHDVGGPSANLRSPACKAQLKRGTCKNRQCLHPEPCPNLELGACHREYLSLLRRVRAVPGVKKAFVRSGLRFDAIMYARANDPRCRFLEELCEHHVSGQLKVAPEHVSKKTLSLMGKSKREVYDAFCAAFRRANASLGKEQYLVPYLISGHPGSSLRDAVELAEYLRDARISPEQVQDFYPTPGTLSTCMYYTGIAPRTLRKLHVPDAEEKAMQRALLQYGRPQNRALVKKALIAAGREDLIGYGPRCLIRPDRTGRPERTGRPGDSPGRSDRPAIPNRPDRRSGRPSNYRKKR